MLYEINRRRYFKFTNYMCFEVINFLQITKKRTVKIEITLNVLSCNLTKSYD